MHSNAIKPFTQHFKKMLKYDKCDDITNALSECEQALNYAYEILNEKNRRYLSIILTSRGILRCKMDNFKHGVWDFNAAGKNDPDIHMAPLAKYCYAFTVSLKFPLLGGHSLDFALSSDDWVDICNMEKITSIDFFAAENMRMWKRLLFQWGIFPDMWDKGFQNDFCEKFKTLYHTVREEYDSKFCCGDIVLTPLTKLRSLEADNAARDVNDGVVCAKIPLFDRMMHVRVEIEAFIFCFSHSKEAADERPGITHRIDTKNFIENFLPQLSPVMKSERFGDLVYFSNNKPYSNKMLGVHVSAGLVSYGLKDNICSPNPFIKSDGFVSNKEVRIVVTLFHKSDNPADDGDKITPLSIAGDNPGVPLTVPGDWRLDRR